MLNLTFSLPIHDPVRGRFFKLLEYCYPYVTPYGAIKNVGWVFYPNTILPIHDPVRGQLEWIYFATHT